MLLDCLQLERCPLTLSRVQHHSMMRTDCFVLSRSCATRLSKLLLATWLASRRAWSLWLCASQRARLGCGKTWQLWWRFKHLRSAIRESVWAQWRALSSGGCHVRYRAVPRKTVCALGARGGGGG